MHDAMRYISILSLLRYNLVLQKYRKYYYGIIPIMNGKEVAIISWRFSVYEYRKCSYKVP